MFTYEKKYPLLALCSCLFLLSLEKANAAISLHKLFADHAVFQRNVEVPVWGWALPGEEISLTIDGRTLKTRAIKMATGCCCC